MTENRKTNVTKTHKKHASRTNWDEGNTYENCNKSMNKYRINHNLSFQIIKKKKKLVLFLTITVVAGAKTI